ncbi:PIR protein CIR protein [Plasmodium vinckei lentum]|uniref:PIR protein CIR protein n=1 Tax=Plasmodium vinckei lentum TaxID=138297 RepID=A0A6V7RV24_PLAVN|nr:PIR protein CIR protein [Plasmodium vinckei lentum]
MDDKACDLLNEVDEYFNNRGVNERKFNKSTKYHSYCPYENNSKENKCTNDYERFNALGSYLFTKISEIGITYKQKKGVSHHIELFMIWLGSKLFKMDNDYKATLEESYKKHLVNIMGKVNYWEIISKNIYKDATIRKMDELYSLLNNICKLITEYNKNTQKPDNRRLGNHSTQCINSYRSFYRSASGCKPYLRLLDNLKMIYENFRFYKMDLDSSLKGHNKELLLKRIKHLTMFKDENQLFVSVNENLSFDDKECKEAKSKDEQVGKSIASKNLPNNPKGTGPIKKPDTGPQKKSHPNTPQRKPTLPAPAKPPVQPPPASSLQTSQKSETSHQSGAKGSDIKKGNKGDGSSVSGGAVNRPESSEGKPKDAEQKKPKPVGTPSPGPKEGSQPTGLKNQGSGTDDHVAKGSQGGSISGIDGGGDSAQGDQGGQGESSDKTGSGAGGHVDKGSQGSSGNQAKHSEDSSHGNTASAPSGAGTTPSPVQLPSASQSPPVSPESQPQPHQQPADSLPKDPLPTGSPPAVQQPDSSLQTSDPQKPGPLPQPPTVDPVPPAQDGRSSQTSQTGGSSNQNEQKDSSDSKGGTEGTKDNKGDPNDGSKDPGDGSRDSASSTSGGSFDWSSSIFEFILKGKEYYNKASEFIEKNRQTFEDAKDKINGAYNQAKDNLKTTYDQSNKYLNKLINDVIDQLNKNDTPSKSNNKQPGPGSPMGGGNKSNQPPSNPQPNPPPIIPPTPSKDLLQQKQPSPQPQIITSQNPQVNQTNHQRIGQFVKSLSSDLILKKPWNIFPTTWNGSGDCKPEIKFMNATLVCCTSEQCSLTGISVTLVLIPIILLIVYKYLSFGSSKKSEKKNMKRVIKLVDGNRKTKIIISSYDNKKDLKPVINSVGGKKGPLLNIYKLIRADPMPFINLFFLLIFFVYKRKRDTIE